MQHNPEDEPQLGHTVSYDLIPHQMQDGSYRYELNINSTAELDLEAIKVVLQHLIDTE